MLSAALSLTTKATTSRSLLASVLSHKLVAAPQQHNPVVLHSHSEETLKHVEEIDTKRENKEPLSLLAGIPISIKDNFNTVGLRTTAASQMLAEYDSAYDAEVVAKLRSHGAVICAKANLDEFGMGSSMSNSAFGPCASPWSINEGITPGGSSGASAVLVSSGVVTAAIASDTGGSVRQPASFCGVVGLKPTYGTLSRHGLISYASSMDTPGIITQTVIDSALLLATLAGADAKDPSSVDSDHSNLITNLLGEEVRDFNIHQPVDIQTIELLSNLANTTIPYRLKGMRVGIPHEFIVAEMDGHIIEAWKSAVAALEEGGAIVKTVNLPSFKMALPCYYVIACAEASSNLARYDGLRYGSGTGKHDKEPSHVDITSKQSHAAYDFLQSIAGRRGKLFGPEVIKRILTGSFVLTKGAIDNFYGKAQQMRMQLVNETAQVFGKEVDTLLFPTSPKLPFMFSDAPTGVEMLLHDLFTVVANLSGCPAISVPVGVGDISEKSTSNRVKVPIGMQVMASRHDELSVLKAALVLEQKFKFREKFRPPQ